MPYKDKEKQREYDRIWIATRRAEYFKDKTCFMCGTSENLELDHRDPSQKEHHAIWSWSKERRETELAKCDPLCHDCHKLKTLLMDMRFTDHGKIGCYRNGCRCDACKQAKLEESRRASKLRKLRGR